MKFPSIVIIVYGTAGTGSAQALLELGRLGVSSAITLDVDDAAHRIRDAIRSATAGGWMDGLLNAMRSRLPSTVHMLITRALHWPLAIDTRSAPLTPHSLARCYGWHTRTLERHLRREGLPPPARLIMWCRLLRAVRLLEDTGRTAENVAPLAGFADGAQLRKALQRYSGVSPRELLRRGGASALLERFTAELTGHVVSARLRSSDDALHNGHNTNGVALRVVPAAERHTPASDWSTTLRVPAGVGPPR